MYYDWDTFLKEEEEKEKGGLKFRWRLVSRVGIAFVSKIKVEMRREETVIIE